MHRSTGPSARHTRTNLVDRPRVGSKLPQQGAQSIQQVLVLHVDDGKAIQCIRPAGHPASRFWLVHCCVPSEVAAASLGRQHTPLHPIRRELQALNDLV